MNFRGVWLELCRVCLGSQRFVHTFYLVWIRWGSHELSFTWILVSNNPKTPQRKLSPNCWIHLILMSCHKLNWSADLSEPFTLLRTCDKTTIQTSFIQVQDLVEIFCTTLIFLITLLLWSRDSISFWGSWGCLKPKFKAKLGSWVPMWFKPKKL